RRRASGLNALFRWLIFNSMRRGRLSRSGASISQIDYPGFRQALCDQNLAQIDPTLHAVEYVRIGCHDDLIGGSQDLVRVHHDLDAPWPVMLGGHLPNSLRQAAAVRNGLIQQPQGRSRFRIEQSLADQSDRLLGLGDGSVRAVNARHVADAAVAAADQHAARKRGLRSDDDVESVYQQVLSVDRFERQAGLFARFSLPVRAGGPGYGQPLALFEREM